MNDIVWWYKDPSGGTTRSFRRKHDLLLFYAKTPNYIFNVDAVRVPYSEGTIQQAEKGTTSFGRVVKVNPLGKLPDDVFEISIINSQAKERTDYPTQKPEALLERIIKASSNQGDLSQISSAVPAPLLRLPRSWDANGSVPILASLPFTPRVRE